MVTKLFVRLKVFVCVDHTLHVLRAQHTRVKPAVGGTGQVGLGEEDQTTSGFRRLFLNTPGARGWSIQHLYLYDQEPGRISSHRGELGRQLSERWTTGGINHPTCGTRRETQSSPVPGRRESDQSSGCFPSAASLLCWCNRGDRGLSSHWTMIM